MGRGLRKPDLEPAESYTRDEEALLRPEVGSQTQFRKRKSPQTCRYVSSPARRAT